jgi:CheY-like chemotaxis protein
MANPSDADPKGAAPGPVPPASEARPQRDDAGGDAFVPAPSSASMATPEEERILQRPERRAFPPDAGVILHDLHIVAVDDDLEMLGLLRTILEGAGAKVTTVTNATGALQTLNLLRPDVLVADLAMPMMDGFSLIHRVRHASDPVVRGIPAVAVTGRAESEARAMVLDSGFEIYLPKPVDPDELVAAVAGLARRPKR